LSRWPVAIAALQEQAAPFGGGQIKPLGHRVSWSFATASPISSEWKRRYRIRTLELVACTAAARLWCGASG
jgi:hypothetical protein